MRRLFGVFFILAFLLLTVSILTSADKPWTKQLASTGLSNYSAPGSSYKTHVCTLTVAGRDTVWTEKINIIKRGYHAVQIWTSSDSVDLSVYYKASMVDSTSYWFKCAIDSFTTITDTVSSIPIALSPAAVHFVKFRFIGGAGNKAGGSSARVYFLRWN